jgi:hypothetical protein
MSQAERSLFLSTTITGYLGFLKFRAGGSLDRKRHIYFLKQDIIKSHNPATLRRGNRVRSSGILGHLCVYLHSLRMQFQAKRANDFKYGIKSRSTFARKCFVKAFSG